MRPALWAAVRAARIVHAYRAELARLSPPAKPARAEQGTTSAATQINTSPPPTHWRTGKVGPPTALDGIGFLATKRADNG